MSDSKLSCYGDQSRICGPDCMSYLAQVPSGANYQGENWAHCLVLVNVERMGKHIVIMADLIKRNRAEGIRNQSPPPLIRKNRTEGD
jgi:hypothetical protein